MASQNIEMVERSALTAHVPGFSLAIVENNTMVDVVHWGVCSEATRNPVTVRTIFEAASLSKPVFTHAILRLADECALSLDEPIKPHIPTLAARDARAGSITPRQILCHTSGLPNWSNADVPLKTYFEPGTRFSYSGEGFWALQQVVERITGEPINTIIERKVFEPLQMEHSSFVWSDHFEADHAVPHDEASQPHNKYKPRDPNVAFSLQTTAVDFARFLSAALGQDEVGSEASSSCFAPQIQVPRDSFTNLDLTPAKLNMNVAWGLGWGLETSNGGFFHWGANDGFRAFALGSQEDGKAFIFLANSDNGLQVVPTVADAILPGNHPSFPWLGLGN